MNKFSRLRDFGLVLAASNLTLLGVSAGYGSVTTLPAAVSATLALIGVAMVITSAIMAPPPAVDIWQYQSKLMEISDQRLPGLPEVNEHTLLYFALTLEELGETATALHRAFARDFSQKHGESSMHEFALVNTVMRLNDLNTILTEQAGGLRKNAKRMPGMRIDISHDEARQLLDGTTDTAVTLAGLGLASGLPNPEGYVEVVSSNYSKANPDSGKIDKDATGKWIKGTKYCEPNLAKVLEAQQQAYFRMHGRDIDELNARMAVEHAAHRYAHTRITQDRRHYGIEPKQEG
jgi:hypothetical protein